MSGKSLLTPASSGPNPWIRRKRARAGVIGAVLVVALSPGLIDVADGSSAPSAHVAKASHALSADWKTGHVTGSGDTTSTIVQNTDEAKLVGRPFGKRKAHLAENSLVTYNHPSTGSFRTDYSASVHVTFKAVFSSDNDSFRGFYDYAVDSNANLSGPITGSITGGRGTFRGAKGSFQIVDFTVVNIESAQYKGHWQGSIRY